MITRTLGGVFGTERVVALSGALLKKAGHEVTMIAELSESSPSTGSIDRLFSFDAFSRLIDVRATRRKLLEMVTAVNPDVVHLTEQLDSRLLLPLIARFPVCLTSHTVATTSPSSCRVINGKEICQLKSGWQCLIHHHRYHCLDYLRGDLRRIHALYEYQSRRRSHRRVHAVLGPSLYMCKLLKFDGWDNSRIHLVVNPVPLSMPNPLPDAPTNLISTAARLVPMKGIDRLIQALALLHNRSWTLWVCGDGPERERLEKLVASLKLSERVVFKGITDPTLTARIMASSRLYVQPNLGPESFGLAAAEASSLGVPVVAFDVPGLNETVIQSRSGLLAKPTDVSGLRDAILSLLEDDDLAQALGRAGKSHVQEHFSEHAHLTTSLVAYEAARTVFNTNT